MNKKYNYTYLITELSSNKKYIGVRSSDIEPNLDLGSYYFSSSTNKPFIKRQRENIFDYKYDILSVYSFRKKLN